jgi:hypothetical protein
MGMRARLPMLTAGCSRAALRDAIAYHQQHAGSGLEHHVLLMAYREL